MLNAYESAMHCHSSTAVIILIKSQVVVMISVYHYIRPRFSRRKTAQSLIDAKQTTLIADSAAESFVIGEVQKSIDTFSLS